MRLAAVEAFAAFFHSITKKQQSKYYALLPEVLNILPPLQESGDSDNLSKAFIALIELAEVAPKMFKSLFNTLVLFSIKVIQDKDLGDATRQNALELMATFADYSPAMCRKDPDYVTSMITQCLSLMTDIGLDDEDASEWNQSEDVRTKILRHTPADNVSSTLKRATKTMSQGSNAWIDSLINLVAKPCCLSLLHGYHE